VDLAAGADGMLATPKFPQGGAQAARDFAALIRARNSDHR
jgi:hypothetical protein